MKNFYIKLIAMSLALVLSVSVVIMSSYAWLVLAGNPAVSGIQVAVGGGNTILTAPDITEVDRDGTIYHYPGHFSDKLNFGMQTSYAYLQNLGNLTPVSTTNGEDWFIPTYYSGNDPAVQEGKIPSGTLRDISDFLVDSELSYANLDPENEEDNEKIDKGSYIYLDFWVVAPAGDYTLRVSTGTGTSDGGSFVIDLMEPVKSGDSYTLANASASAAATVRVGFLANDLMLVDNTMLQYQSSRYFDDRFTSLRGMYQEPNTGAAYLEENRFTIYEPNGDYHPTDTKLDGGYVETKPLGLSRNQILEQRTRDNLTVQRKNIWAEANNHDGSTAIEQQFKTALFSWTAANLTISEISNRFYGKTLQGQISPYVSKGSFIKNTNNLYAQMTNGTMAQADLDVLDQAGATDDVYIIKLERNVPQRIRMFIWLEGQDIDCVDSVHSARFAVNIELAGGEK